jgi:hypothetical protein
MQEAMELIAGLAVVTEDEAVDGTEVGEAVAKGTGGCSGRVDAAVSLVAVAGVVQILFMDLASAKVYRAQLAVSAPQDRGPGISRRTLADGLDVEKLLTARGRSPVGSLDA